MLKTFKVMKGFELVKREDHWGLYNEDGHKIAATIDGCYSKLSIKNCQVIECGYDLDELAKTEAMKISETEIRDEKLERIYKRGFQKALELLGDKKFSEEDMIKFMQFTISIEELGNTSSVSTSTAKYYLDNFTSNLKQNEWDVEICCYIGNGDKESDSFNDPLVTNTGIPKLDEDGCLILRRK